MMGKQVRKIISGIFFLALFAAGYSQATGIRKVETKTKTTVYEIKVADLSGPAAARFLDMKMLERQGIMNTVTDAISQVCKVEVLSWLGEKELRWIIEGTGFSVAKIFE